MAVLLVVVPVVEVSARGVVGLVKGVLGWEVWDVGEDVSGVGLGGDGVVSVEGGVGFVGDVKDRSMSV